MVPFKKLQDQWRKHRERLEREIRVLVVDDDPAVQKQLEEVLYGSRIASRAIRAADRVINLVAREQYSLVIISDHFPEMEQLELIDQIREFFPEVDLVISSRGPSDAMLNAAFAYRVFDILIKPLGPLEEVGRRLQDAVKRNANRRMHSYAIRQLREELERLDPAIRKQLTGQLERRLAGFKTWVGDFNRVLVVEEQDTELRQLAESLLVQNLEVETAESFDEAMLRVVEGGIHLLVMKVALGQNELSRLAESVQLADSLVELIWVSERPEIEAAQVALQLDVACYLPWPPRDLSTVVVQACEILDSSRQDRLLDNLLVTLFWETQQAASSPPKQEFAAFCELVGLTRVVPLTEWLAEPRREQVGVMALDRVLDDILDQPKQQVEEPPPEPGPESTDDGEWRDRREFVRVVENQFLRFRPSGSATSIVAYMGDVSEGGLFIRTTRLSPPGTRLDLDLNVEYKGAGYIIRCNAEVAWVAASRKQFPLGPGFGVKFLDPPADVTELLKRLVESLARPR